MIRFARLLLVFVLCDTVFADDWYRWRGPNDDGISTEDQWDHNQISSESIRWRQSVGVGYCSVVVRGDLLYTMGNEEEMDIVRCLRASTGDTVWKFSYPSPLDDRDFEGGPTSTPTIDTDRVYTLSRAGDVHCFHAESGKILWRQQIVDLTNIRIPGWGFSAAPVVIGDTLLINAGDAGVALNKMTGKLIWKSADKDCGYGTPTLMKVGQGTAAVIPSGRSYVAVDIDSGQELWRQRWLTTFGCNAADPIVLGNRVFLSSGYNRGAALLEIERDQVRTLWKNKLMQNQISTSLLLDGYLYGIDGDVERGAKLTCLELATGNVQWSQQDLEPAAITATRSRLIVMTLDGQMVVVSAKPKQFEELSRVKLLQGKCWASPVISNQRLLCRSVSGDLVCVDLPAKK